MQVLHPAYEAYVRDVSTAGMAASLETAALLSHLVEATGPRTLVDLGSGFSSWVLREAAPPGATVLSFDTDAGWLERTAARPRSRDASTTGLHVWPDERDALPEEVDLAFHDLAGGEIRNEVMVDVLDRIAPGGFAVIDDMHAPTHRWALERALAERQGLLATPLVGMTRDDQQRWAWVVHRPATG
jgi:predicted O-methyltransferase YrrM